MFVRFRKKPSDGTEPQNVATKILCAGGCWRYRGIGAREASFCGCPWKPRCRWRIGVDEGIELQPYRLNVSIIENRRIDGKIRQEHIATLGAIDGVYLAEFWDGVETDIASRVRSPQWELRSIKERQAFWQVARSRLQLLDNRLGPDMKRIRMTIHARIPFPLQSERDRLELLEAESDLKFVSDHYEFAAKMIESQQSVIDSATKSKTDFNFDSLKTALQVQKARDRVKALREVVQ